MRNVNNSFDNIKRLLDSVDDARKVEIIICILHQLATLQNLTHLECVQVFVSTLASDKDN
ncbi:MAG: hypothetical protein IJ516_05525 [Phascolarctobacterium sp.]|nr:hypothetical protein [Phascolarctobacterium sp.]